MSSLLELERFPQTAQLIEAVNEQFAKGAESVSLVKDSQIIGTLLSRDAAQKALARKVAEQWLANPDILDDLATSLNEEAEDWE